MYDIITLGSATTDIFVKTKIKPEIKKHDGHTDMAYHLGDKLLIDDLKITTGGGGTNAAVGFSRLGLKTAYIGAIGNDANGIQLLSVPVLKSSGTNLIMEMEIDYKQHWQRKHFKDFEINFDF